MRGIRREIEPDMLSTHQLSLEQLAGVTGGTATGSLPGHSFTKDAGGLSISCTNSNPSVTKPTWQCEVRATEHPVLVRPGRPLRTNAIAPVAPPVSDAP